MTNSSLPTDVTSNPGPQTQGITEIRQKTIAALIARGFSVKYVAKKLKMSESRIYHLLSDKDSLVNAEIKRIFTALFASADGRLLNLYNKALQKLDTMLSSSDEEKQYRAMDRIIKMFFARIPKNTIIQQYFGDQLQPQREFTMDDYILFSKKFEKIILEKRKERGLPAELPDYEDNSDSTPDNSSDPTPKDSSASSPDVPSQDAPAQDAPSPDTSCPEYEAFLEQITRMGFRVVRSYTLASVAIYKRFGEGHLKLSRVQDNKYLPQRDIGVFSSANCN
jgi:AcrR family transcriptional regulator